MSKRKDIWKEIGEFLLQKNQPGFLVIHNCFWQAKEIILFILSRKIRDVFVLEAWYDLRRTNTQFFFCPVKERLKKHTPYEPNESATRVDSRNPSGPLFWSSWMYITSRLDVVSTVFVLVQKPSNKWDSKSNPVHFWKILIVWATFLWIPFLESPRDDSGPS